jgi:2-aminoadipate transaminase
MRSSSPVQSPSLSLSSKAQRTHEQPISVLIAEAVANPALINLAAGLVDESTLPAEIARAAVDRILSDPAEAQRALQYGTTLGLAGLRRCALGHLEALENKPARQMGLSADDILITTGSQQALYLLGDVLLDPGDIVIAANPSYFVYTGALASLAANVLTVPMDEHGMDVDAVDRLLAKIESEGQLPRVKFVYCTSYFQNPTGLTLSAERRPRLLEIVRKYSKDHRLLILEDAAYRELRYDGPALPSIKSFDSENLHTILTQTFSKPFAPGIKTGYTAMPKDVLAAVVNQKGNHDFGSANLCQYIAWHAMKDGGYHQQVKRLQSNYKMKRDLMLQALSRYMPAGTTWTHPNGGLYVWVTLPASMNTSRDETFFRRCVDNGVLYVPGEYCFQPDDNGVIPQNQLRLSFGQVRTELVEEGVRRLGQVVVEFLESPAPRVPASRHPQVASAGDVNG